MIFEAKTKATEKSVTGEGLTTLTLKQMIQSLPIALAHVKAVNNSKGLLNDIRRIVYSLFQSKELTKKVYQSNYKNGYHIYELKK